MAVGRPITRAFWELSPTAAFRTYTIRRAAVTERLTFENTLIGLGGSAVANFFQEFLVRKLTPHGQGKP
jgi:hypothetical protein